ncbi:MAG: hypothetical protein ACMG51_04645 [Ginsengibacter sp.]
MEENQNIKSKSGEQPDTSQNLSDKHNSPKQNASPVPEGQLASQDESNNQQNPINQQSKTISMEVHHPPHPSHKKKWTEYLLEFFMLFLAVFLGFLAESKREQMVEKHRETEYMHLLLQDLKQDSSRFNTNINYNKQDLAMIDSAINMLNSFQITDSISKALYYSHLVNPYFGILVFNQRTISQLKTAGGFRLISRQDVSDKIIQYYDAIENAEWLRQEVLSALKDDRASGYYIFNDNLIKEYNLDSATNIMRSSKKFLLLTNDKKVLIPYANKLKMRHDWLVSYNGNLINLQKKCKQLIDLVNKEYH